MKEMATAWLQLPPGIPGLGLSLGFSAAVRCYVVERDSLTHTSSLMSGTHLRY